MIRVQLFATYSGLPSGLAIVTGPSRSADIESGSSSPSTARGTSSERAGSGHRRYPRPVLRRIAFIVFA